MTGASSGIGRQIAIGLARQYGSHGSAGRETAAANLVIHFRKNQRGAEETAAAVESLGATTRLIQADICQAEQRRRLLEESWDFLGPPTTWVNNAGADVLTGEFRNESFAEKLRRLIETDVLATIDLSRQVIRRWISDFSSGDSKPDAADALPVQPPSMTFIGWDQAPLGMEGDAGQMFGPVKAAVMAFANSVAQEVGPNIRVNTVAPGWIKTAWGETTDSYWDGRARRQSLMNRWGTPEDVARAVCFVADPDNTFCSGQTIQVNGGWSRTHPR
ncbi:SDR family oxidoreductase [Stieleria sp. ICT_E10.1]|uniref:SDR family NAD(P)-dependent oxidoreductase n=1 Tax=Stieleria sedimenti TaxID=2976331 RepID=UPI00217FFD3F|nr:SDR family oxidoreductase [Stieleria sedimenti]MCS7470166.1 SDR family oxidoreductase [Stieleria sedimenti]